MSSICPFIGYLVTYFSLFQHPRKPFLFLLFQRPGEFWNRCRFRVGGFLRTRATSGKWRPAETLQELCLRTGPLPVAVQERNGSGEFDFQGGGHGLLEGQSWNWTQPLLHRWKVRHSQLSADHPEDPIRRTGARTQRRNRQRPYPSKTGAISNSLRRLVPV